MYLFQKLTLVLCSTSDIISPLIKKQGVKHEVIKEGNTRGL